MQCPRCHGPLDEAQLAGAGEGAYRGSYVGVHRCARCRVSVMSAAAHARANGTPNLAQTMLARASEPVSHTCFTCVKSLVRLTLSWGEEWLEVEECPGCGLLVFDDGEVDRVRALLSASVRPR